MTLILKEHRKVKLTKSEALTYNFLISHHDKHKQFEIKLKDISSKLNVSNVTIYRSIKTLCDKDLAVHVSAKYDGYGDVIAERASHKTDCFAYTNKAGKAKCNVLIELDCVNCKFYKAKGIQYDRQSQKAS